jgi:hypothetical protein
VFRLTTICVSSYCYICVLILPYLCPHTTTCVLILLYMCPHTTKYVSKNRKRERGSRVSWCSGQHTTICVSSYCICVLILLNTCPKIEREREEAERARVQVSTQLYVCPHTAYVSSYYYICVHRKRESGSREGWCSGQHTIICVSSYYYICVLMLLYMCPHTTICVLILQYMCPHTTKYVSSYYYIGVLIPLRMCPHSIFLIEKKLKKKIADVCQHGNCSRAL